MALAELYFQVDHMSVGVSVSVHACIPKFCEHNHKSLGELTVSLGQRRTD